MTRNKNKQNKELIITEKPSVAKDIIEAIGGFKSIANGEYYESDKYVCTYAVGHIIRLSEPEELDNKYKKWKLADLPIIPKEFKLFPINSQKKRLKVIEQLLKRTDIVSVINACDAAREGELIFREIIKYFNCSKPIKRLWLQSMTKAAIQESFQNLKDGRLYNGLANASECRAYSDWLFGLNATRALTIRLHTRKQNNLAWSAGRVQTPTLTILVNRELEILSHIPKPFYKIIAKFKAKDHDYEGIWFDPNFKKSLLDEHQRDDRIFDKSKANKILEDILNKKALAYETRKEKLRNPPLLFDLTSLQREANRRFGWSAARTASAAQRCYETHKVLTYPRTASRVLPSDYKKEVQKILSSFINNDNYSKFATYLLNNGLKNQNKIFNDSGVSDHFAIIPTGEFAPLKGDDEKLFDLVVKQFFAAFYPAAIYEDIERITVVEKHSFKTKPPQSLKYSGWLEVWGKESQDIYKSDITLPPLSSCSDGKKKTKVENIGGNITDHETKPPGRITEAGLLSLMENAGNQIEDEELSEALQKAEGLGTAATRADIIENLKMKEYVEQSLKPTLKGIILIDILKRINTEILTSPKLTAKLELQLSKVENNEKSPQHFMNEIYNITNNIVEAIKSFDFKKIYPNTDSLGKCPRCGGEVYERPWYYECEHRSDNTYDKHCPFVIWKNISGRYMDRANVSFLLKNGKTNVLSDFVDIKNNIHKAYLEIVDGNIIKKSIETEKISNENQPKIKSENLTSSKLNTNHKYSEQPTNTSSPLILCPIHKDKKCWIVETDKYFVCQTMLEHLNAKNNKKDGFLLPKVICKRLISKEELIDYVKNGETDYLYNFISKKGKKFSAKLILNKDGNFSFEFYNKF